MNTQKIEEFFYLKASTRICDRVRNSKLKNRDIYPPDEKQISRIVNNTRGKNNRFLISDAVISNHYKNEETGEYISCGLLHTKDLKFNSTKEILWGTNAEIKSYLHDLFRLLWNEVTENSFYDIDSDFFLCDFVPYAKNRAYWDIIFNRDKYPALFYGFREDIVIQNIESTKEQAIDFLYKRCRNDFSKRFIYFTKQQKSFHKLNKIIQHELIEKIFIPIIEKHKPTSSSLGLRVKNIIYADISHCAPLVANKSFDFPFPKLISASTQYISQLEDIQKESLK